jgi:elongator complex protein 5
MFRATGKGVHSDGESGVVVEMELRRRSGRGVKEVFVLTTTSKHTKSLASTGPTRAGLNAKVSLLDDHPLYAPPDVGGVDGRIGGEGEDEGLGETTFSLGLTEKQRIDREGVVLPYFDAQSGEGVGEGGRILYEMDRGDDFDEEEDEI